MEIGIAIILENEIHNYARGLELKLCQQFGLLQGIKQPPHITIKAPFEVDNIEPFSDYLNELACSISPFEIELEGFGHFGNNVIYLDVKESPLLLKLHLRILEDCQRRFGIVPGQFEGQGVKFHSTLAYNDISDAIFTQAWQWLNIQKPHFIFKFKTIGLCYHLSEEAGWIIYKRSKCKFHRRNEL